MTSPKEAFLQCDILTEAHIAVELMIYKICHNEKRFRFEDALSIAHEAFVDAVLTYDEDLSEFTTWVSIKIRNAHNQTARKFVQEQKQINRFIHRQNTKEKGKPFDVRDLIEQVSEDCKDILSIYFDEETGKLIDETMLDFPPSEIKEMINEFAEGCSWKKQHLRHTLKEIRDIYKP